MDNANQYEYQAIPPFDVANNAQPKPRRSRTSVAFSQLFAIFHIVVGSVLPLAKAFEKMHATREGHERDLQSWHLDIYYIYLCGGSIVLMIVMRAAGMLTTHEGQQSHQAASKFIKGGAALFAACGMLIKGYKLGCVIDGSCDYSKSYKAADGVEAVLGFLFILQLWLFVCVYSNKCITKWKRLARIAIMLMWATCLSCWSRDFVHEVSEDLEKQTFNYDIICRNKNPPVNIINGDIYSRFLVNLASSQVNGSNNDSHKTFKDALESESPILIPGAMEFYLIMSGFMYVMYGNIGRHADNVQEEQPRKHYYSLQKSLIGLGGGILVIIISVIVVKTHTNSEDQDADWAKGIPSAIYYLFMVCVYPLCILGNLIAHIKMRRSTTWQIDDEREDELRLTMVLMYISASGMFVYSMFSIIAAALSTHSVQVPNLLLYHECLKIVDIFISVTFLYDALHRRPPPDFRPNFTRQIIIFVLFVNGMFWYTNILELKDVGLCPIQYCFYGYETWSIILHLVNPLILYFRFHSMVLYFEVWLSG
ncbi:proton channel OtopLc-like [Glandiceps talaboti]